jgi:hypothetical protein
MRTVHVASLLCLAFPAAAMAASAPPSRNVPPPSCAGTPGFPALDAASKDAAKMSVKIKPEYTRYKKGSQSSQGTQGYGTGGGEGKASLHDIHAPGGAKTSAVGTIRACGGAHADEAPKETHP